MELAKRHSELRQINHPNTPQVSSWLKDNIGNEIRKWALGVKKNYMTQFITHRGHYTRYSIVRVPIYSVSTYSSLSTDPESYVHSTGYRSYCTNLACACALLDRFGWKLIWH